MELEATLREWILMDYQLCEANIRQITSGRASNRKLIGSDYLRPTTVPEVVSIEDSRGTLAYYTLVKNNLETALREGHFPSSFKSFEPPVNYWHLIKPN